MPAAEDLLFSTLAPSLCLLLFLGGGGEQVKGAGLYLGVEANPPSSSAISGFAAAG